LTSDEFEPAGLHQHWSEKREAKKEKKHQYLEKELLRAHGKKLANCRWGGEPG